MAQSSVIHIQCCAVAPPPKLPTSTRTHGPVVEDTPTPAAVGPPLPLEGFDLFTASDRGLPGCREAARGERSAPDLENWTTADLRKSRYSDTWPGARILHRRRDIGRHRPPLLLGHHARRGPRI